MKDSERPLNARVREPQVIAGDRPWGLPERLAEAIGAMKVRWAPAVFTAEEETLP